MTAKLPPKTPPELYLRQIEIGPMANFVYLVGDPDTRETAVVDPAWDVPEILEIAGRDDRKITKVFLTHFHPDHTNGVEALLEKIPAQVYVQKTEIPYLKWLKIPESVVVKVEEGHFTELGKIRVTFLHTPGHTPGSQCFAIQRNLVTGDTLFIGACGRTDLPGGDPEEMFRTLSRLGKLEERTIVFPGHNYARQQTSTIANEKRSNPYLRCHTLEEFLRISSGP